MARIVFALTCLTVLFAGDSAQAQRRTPGFVNRPTLSPYVNLFRANNGGLNSYFSFVRPQIEAQQFMQATNRQAELNRLAVQQETLQLQQALQQGINPLGPGTLQQRPTANSAVRRPRARFMSFGGFFPSNNGTTTRR